MALYEGHLLRFPGMHLEDLSGTAEESPFLALAKAFLNSDLLRGEVVMDGQGCCIISKEQAMP